jgi:multidrug efflux pump subunit AcrA (membrane-fusion protein)
MLGRVTITTAARADALVLPKEALSGTPAPGPTEIFLVEGGQTARRTPVSIGLVNERYVEILEGVQEGQLVVTGNVSNLSDGDRVAPQSARRIRGHDRGTDPSLTLRMTAFQEGRTPCG